MDLFIADQELEFEKTATVELEEDPHQWPRQVLTELYRTLPSIADYTPEVKFLRMDEEQGFALGVVVLSNLTNSALVADATQAANPKRALIPVVVKNHKLCPMDILVSPARKMYPLTDDRLREVMYRPESFELVTNDWNDTSLWQMFSPPGRSDISPGSGMSAGDGGGVSRMAGPGMKFAMLEMLSTSILEPDMEAFRAELQETPGLIKAAGKNNVFLAALQKLASAELVNAKTASNYEQSLASMHPAQVFQLGYDDMHSQYWLRTANRDAALVTKLAHSRGEILKIAGKELVHRVDTEGTVTVAEPKIIAGPEGDEAFIADERGAFTAFLATGESKLVYVFPRLFDATGAEVPICLITDGRIAVTQDQVAVTRSGCRDLMVQSDPPKGTGCFYITGHRSPTKASIPVTILSANRIGDRTTSYQCVDLGGEKLTITVLDGAEGVVAIPGKREIIMPFGTRFCAVDLNGPVYLSKASLSDAAKAELSPSKTASVHRMGNETYLIDAPALVKMAGFSGPVSYDDAMFTLCFGGLTAPQASQVLNTAEKLASATTQVITPVQPDRTEQHKLAAERIERVHALRRSCVKEAAALPDTMTVDAMLSLGFINSENVEDYVARIPHLEKALNTLCELTLASRVGLNGVSESACSRAARSLNEVLRGLKGLALREISEVS